MADPYVQDIGVGAIDTLADLEKQKKWAEKNLSSLKRQYAHHRFSTYKARKNFLKRIKHQELVLHAVLAELHNLQNSTKYALYTKTQAKVSGGINVTVELSLDGTVYSNPAPSIPNGAHVWVRCTIDDSHRGEIGVPKTHEMCHLTWVHTTPGYSLRDTIPSTGHDEYFVSLPLVVTREFHAPSSGVTRSNWLVYVDVYEKVNVDRLE